MPTGLIYDDRFRDHDTGPHHPERPERMDAAIASLRDAAWHDELLVLEASAADLSVIESTHSLAYIRRAEAACRDHAPFLDTTDVTSLNNLGQTYKAAGRPADALNTCWQSLHLTSDQPHIRRAYDALTPGN